MFEYPFIVGGVGIMFGYILAMLQRAQRYDDPEYLKFFRRYELLSLLQGRKKTLARYNQQIRERAERSQDPRLSTSVLIAEN